MMNTLQRLAVFLRYTVFAVSDVLLYYIQLQIVVFILYLC